MPHQRSDGNYEQTSEQQINVSTNPKNHRNKTDTTSSMQSRRYSGTLPSTFVIGLSSNDTYLAKRECLDFVFFSNKTRDCVCSCVLEQWAVLTERQQYAPIELQHIERHAVPARANRIESNTCTIISERAATHDETLAPRHVDVRKRSHVLELIESVHQSIA